MGFTDQALEAWPHVAADRLTTLTATNRQLIAQPAQLLQASHLGGRLGSHRT